MTDPISDMLNQIKNATAVGKAEVVLPFSNLKQAVANVLVQEQFIADAKKIAKGKNKVLKISLKYDAGMPAISGFKRVSKPGQRIYTGAAEMKKVRGGFGISVVSTPKGLMTGSAARKAKLGGEVMCHVW
jgi:small subunit ribosomal protein S8